MKINRMILTFMVCLLSAASSHNLSATVYPWQAEMRVHAGWLTLHKRAMLAYKEQRPVMFELSYARSTTGRRAWERFYHFPQWGASYIFINLGSPSILGNAHGLMPFMNYALTESNRRLSLNMRIGAGAAYVTKIFNPTENYRNIAISTHLNALLRLQMEGRLRITPRLNATAGCAFTHLSNGTMLKPNAGLNYISMTAGMAYAFGNARATETPAGYDVVNKRWHLNLYLSGGMKDYLDFKTDSGRYTALGLSVELSRRHTAFTGYSVAAELFYDASDRVSLREDSVIVKPLQTVKPALNVGYGFYFGRLSAVVNVGAYLHARDHEFGFVYERLLLACNVSPRWTVRLGLKTHQSRADYIEFSIGYRIR